MMHIVEFTVGPTTTDTYDPDLRSVVVRWSAPVRPQGSPVHRELESLLENIRGVEYVSVQRYSALVQYTARVTELETLVQDIKEWLEDDNSTLQAHFRQLLDSDTVVLKVTISPSLLMPSQAGS